MKRLTLLFIGALLFPFASLSQSYEQTKGHLSVLTKEQACDDIDSLIYTLNEIHPDMFCNYSAPLTRKCQKSALIISKLVLGLFPNSC